MNRFSHPDLMRASRPANAKSGRGVTAVLGPTNTGKTHLAIERMIAQPSGMIGLPLRLLAREVYGRVIERVGKEAVALVTGEEKILPKGARFLICTVEAMPLEADVHFVAVDEVQIAASLDRGHVFTDRLLNLRGSHETMLLGASTLRPALEALLPGINVVTRPRMSRLEYAGSKKITRLPRRSAIVAFSADEVYAIAELIRRQQGAAAVVLGSLSPRTRNAQVALYQSGDVDYLVATDAIGMGLNLDVDHVAFAGEEKFDGYHRRRLKPAEFAQIAGRAGRHTSDGTFGVTGRVDPFEDELVQRLEAHEFAPEKLLQWRNRELSFDSISALVETLERPPQHPVLVKAPVATDQRALNHMAALGDIRERATGRELVETLWSVAQIPDYRKIAPANHGDMLATIFRDLAQDGAIDEDWFSAQVKQTDVTEGEIDALSNRIAHIRTWTYVSNRAEWLSDAQHWQGETRAIEDRLSDALHERLTKRFVDRRTSVLMKRLRENSMLEAEIAASGAVMVEGHHVGELSAFRFTPDGTADGPDAKAMRGAAQKALASEFEARATRFAAAPNGDIALDSDGTLRWVGAPIGKLVAGEEVLKPRLLLLADDQLMGTARDRVVSRAERWLAHHLETLIKPLQDLAAAEGVDGIARGIAFRVVEKLGVVDRRDIASDMRALEQDQRAQLRRKGVRFGAYHVFLPALLKPAPAALVSLLWALKHDRIEAEGRSQIVSGLASGRTTLAVDESFEPEFYRLAGYRVLGAKAVRVDMLERLADFIRPAMNWRHEAGEKAQPRPAGAWDGTGFVITPDMLSILGATHEDMAAVLKGLGYRNETMKAAKVEAQMARWDGAGAPAVDAEKPVQTGATKNENDAAAETGAASEAGSDAQPQAEPVVVASAGEDASSVALPPTTPTEPTPDAQEDEAAKGEAAAATADAEEEKTIDVWRRAKRERPDGKAHGGGRQRGQRDGQKAREGTGRGKPGAGAGTGTGKGRKGDADGRSKKPAGGKPRFAGKPAAREPDPDSPFAKLAALKDQMKGGK